MLGCIYRRYLRQEALVNFFSLHTKHDEEATAKASASLASGCDPNYGYLYNKRDPQRRDRSMSLARKLHLGLEPPNSAWTAHIPFANANRCASSGPNVRAKSF